MRTLTTMLWACLSWTELLPAQEPVPLQADDLAALAEQIRSLAHDRDNVFIFEENLEKLRRRSDSWAGAELTFDVTVVQVTRTEVVVEMPFVGGLRVAWLPDGRPIDPHSVHARYVAYAGPPSTLRYNLYAVPTTLVIGEGIRLETAWQLRRGDVIALSSRVRSVAWRVPMEFLNDSAVYVTDVRHAERRRAAR